MSIDDWEHVSWLEEGWSLADPVIRRHYYLLHRACIPSDWREMEDASLAKNSNTRHRFHPKWCKLDEYDTHCMHCFTKIPKAVMFRYLLFIRLGD